MRPILLPMLFLLVQCGGSSGQSDLALSANSPLDGGAGELQTVTIANSGGQCDVTYSAGSLADNIFSTPQSSFLASIGSLVALSARPVSGNGAVKWTGTTTTDGSGATYIVTDASNQTVSVCCAVPDGGAC